MRYIRIVATYFWLVFLLTGCTHLSGPRFKLSVEEALAIANAQTQMLELGAFDSLQAVAGNEVLLVDLRPAAAFEKGHREGAVNLPVSELLERESLALLRKHNITVLLAEDVSQAGGPWFLLLQLGLPQVKILNAPALSGPLPVKDRLQAEMPRYDFATIFQQATDRHKKDVEAGRVKVVRRQARKKNIVPAKKPARKTVVEEEEGC